MQGRRVLIVDDEETVRKTLRLVLESQGFEVEEAASGEEAVAKVIGSRPDLILLDLVLPTMSGFECCRILRASSNIPIIIVSGRDAKSDVVTGLELGADDYLTKPFHPPELLARVRAVMRRSRAEQESGELIEAGRVKIDLRQRRVFVGEREVFLTKKEFDLLTELARSPNTVFSREELLERVWGYTYGGEARLVDVHVKRLRDKVESPDAEPLIVTVRGFGYKLVP